MQPTSSSKLVAATVPIPDGCAKLEMRMPMQTPMRMPMQCNADVNIPIQCQSKCQFTCLPRRQSHCPGNMKLINFPKKHNKVVQSYNKLYRIDSIKYSTFMNTLLDYHGKLFEFYVPNQHAATGFVGISETGLKCVITEKLDPGVLQVNNGIFSGYDDVTTTTESCKPRGRGHWYPSFGYGFGFGFWL